MNPAGFVIHSAVHDAREDIQCVLHTHTKAGIAVSAQKNGVLPISQQIDLQLASLAYHDYEGVAFRDDEKSRLQADMGHANFLMLRNHGLLDLRQDHCRCVPVDVQPSRTPADPDCGPVGRQRTHATWNPKIIEGVAPGQEGASGGLGGMFVWPSLIRKLDRIDASYKNQDGVEPRLPGCQRPRDGGRQPFF